MKSRVLLYLGIFQLLIALGALPAGLAMIQDPTGGLNQMTLDLLADLPFSSFLIPGLYLFLINGLGNMAGAILSFMKKKIAAKMAILLGLLMVLWISFQVLWIGYGSILQRIYLIA